MIPSDEQLMAFADGALTPDEEARVARAIAGNPKLLARVEEFRQSRNLVAQALKPLADEPVPSDLERAVMAMVAENEAAAASNVVPFTRKASASPLSRPWSLPLAASIAAVAAGLGGYAMGLSSTGSGHSQTTVAVGEHLPAGLERILGYSVAGSESQYDGSRVRIIATVKAEDGTICREFEVDDLAAAKTTAGIACREQDHWRLDVAVAAAASDGGFAPASSLTVLDTYLDAIGASAPLSPEEEKQALHSSLGTMLPRG